jgi:hypothetical protein
MQIMGLSCEVSISKGRGMSGTYGFVVYFDGSPVFGEIDCVGGTAVEGACIVDEDAVVKD